MKQWLNLYCERSAAESRLNNRQLNTELSKFVLLKYAKDES